MAMTQQDREMVELIAREVACEVGKELGRAQTAAVAQMLELHTASCPHGRRLLESRWFLAGIAALGLVVCGGGSALGQIVLRLLTGS
jgi:hypothetical protein